MTDPTMTLTVSGVGERLLWARHSLCSNAAAQAVDRHLIIAWVGHQTDKMVRRHRHLMLGIAREITSLN